MMNVEAPSERNPCQICHTSGDGADSKLPTFRRDNIDDILANTLQELSVKERENVYFEQHGVSDVIEEVPEFVAQCLEEFNSQLLLLKSSRQPWAEAYNLAESRDPLYVNSPKIRLRFLRTERFDAKKAATRFVLYFDFKKDLFGETKLCKDITYNDLGEEDIKALKKGFLQDLPARDRSGRAVLCIFPSHFDFKEPETLVRKVDSEMLFKKRVFHN
jgi:predicted house-cleaning noncanonical NTP pyrophosphatase (MazG superfamily)